MKSFLSDIDDVPVAMLCGVICVISMNWLDPIWKEPAMAIMMAIFALARGRNGTNQKAAGD
jgi:hypothetical protein